MRDPAAVQRDADNVNWASNSTLDDGSDFYLANRGNNSIVRVHQDGSVVTIRRVMLDDRPLDDARLTALPPLWRDDQIYVTFTDDLHDKRGGVLVMPAF